MISAESAESRPSRFGRRAGRERRPAARRGPVWRVHSRVWV